MQAALAELGARIPACVADALAELTVAGLVAEQGRGVHYRDPDRPPVERRAARPSRRSAGPMKLRSRSNSWR